jgi:hypothetical protein
VGTAVKDKLGVDASKLFEALKYQIHVAINYCHAIDKTDVLWIEVFGDVTVEGQTQIEVKDYKDSLSDSHANFWNTLNNWLKPEFKHQQYANLILLTTQAYGERTSLKDWEQSDTDQRLEILEAIYNAGEARFKNSTQDSKDDAATDASDAKSSVPKPSESLRLQRQVMAPAIRSSLQEALPKIKIITEQPDLTELIARYKIAHLKQILPHRQDEVLDALFGLMTNAKKVTEGWRITGDDFDKRFAELTAKCMIGTLKFPTVDSDEIELEAVASNVSGRLFAVKLNEIESGETAILQATVDLLHAQQYIQELIKDCTTSHEDIKKYSKNQLRLHQSSRAAAIYECATGLSQADLKNASCAFYHGRCAEKVDAFVNYEDTPVEFRNGMYHMLADQEATSPLKQFHWRLWN